MNYGEIIDIEFKPERTTIYSSFTKYFGNPTMTKVKDSGEYSVYMVEISCLLNRENRYLMLVVTKDDKPVRTQEMMDDLKWESLQTRSLYEKHHVVIFKYFARRYPPLMDPIYVTEKKKSHYSYSAKTLPIIVTLLPDLQGEMNYSETGTVVQALEQFQTVINFK